MSQAVDSAIIEFALAMKKADRNYIAQSGKMTLGMQDAWAVYQEACKEDADATRKRKL